VAILAFEIAWDPSVPGTLLYLRDNGVDLLTHAIEDHDGRITLSWESDELIAHLIDWDLWSSGNTLTELSAKASWDGSNSIVTLDEKDKIANHWRSRGIL
jgi:hypothetical protein